MPVPKLETPMLLQRCLFTAKAAFVALALLCAPAWAQNPTCPTAPLGDSTNKCASTAFVQNQIGVGLTVGTTPILNATNPYILYDQNGILGNLPITGTAGNVVLSNAPTIANPTVTGSFTAIGLVTNADLANSGLTISSTAPLTGGGSVSLGGALTLACGTCVTSSGGGAITGTSPISVSAAGVVSITSPLPLTNGGTAASLTASNGGLVYSTGAALAILSGTATANQIPLSGSSGAPAWSTATWPATTTAGTFLISGSANAVTASATPTLGVAGSVVGSIAFANATSGTETLVPATGALGSGLASLQAGTYNLVGTSTTDTLTNKTLTSPILSQTAPTGLAALGFNGGGTINWGDGSANHTGVSLDQTQTLTNKTLTSPTLVTPTLGAATATTVTFSPTTGGIVGTTTNDNTSAGNVGEYVENVIASGSSIVLTTVTPKTIAQISLTAGDWDVDGVGYFLSAGTTTIVSMETSLSLSTNAVDTTSGRFTQFIVSGASPIIPGVNTNSMAVPNYRFSFASTTTVYLVLNAQFGTAGLNGYGIIRARRIR